jgi:hypothetical protein
MNYRINFKKSIVVLGNQHFSGSYKIQSRRKFGKFLWLNVELVITTLQANAVS